ncbi:alpha/beta fold hydrolase [Nocardia paucivorans]|uniref:alpha/beta fold hydrolase n=1 Tax=Nocardia paucivorans TaxID=114259 RepID=UPI000593DF23|nr:alpha/beta fold hydrolase [Nocardia paucivorans]
MTVSTDPFPAVPTRIVRRGDIELAVFECGDPAGPPVLLVHGWPDTHVLWYRVAEALSSHYRVIAFDNRGAGASTVPRTTAAYRLAELAADTRAVANAVASGDRVHIVGHDWGSVIGWDLVGADDAPTFIGSFTSISGPNLDFLGAYLHGPFSPARLRGSVEQGLASGYTFAFRVPRLPEMVLRRLAGHWPRFLSLFDGLDPAVVRTGPTLRADMVNGLELYRANIHSHLRHPRPRPIEVPVQVIVATGDRAVRPVVHAEAGNWVRDLTIREIDARHWSPFTHVVDLVVLTAEFIDRFDSR